MGPEDCYEVKILHSCGHTMRWMFPPVEVATTPPDIEKKRLARSICADCQLDALGSSKVRYGPAEVWQNIPEVLLRPRVEELFPKDAGPFQFLQIEKVGNVYHLKVKDKKQ